MWGQVVTQKGLRVWLVAVAVDGLDHRWSQVQASLHCVSLHRDKADHKPKNHRFKDGIEKVVRKFNLKRNDRGKEVSEY